jgi:hypothetical protein
VSLSMIINGQIFRLSTISPLTAKDNSSVGVWILHSDCDLQGNKLTIFVTSEDKNKVRAAPTDAFKASVIPNPLFSMEYVEHTEKRIRFNRIGENLPVVYRK